MENRNADATLHVDEQLGQRDCEDLQGRLLQQSGVTAAECHEGHSHLFIIRYNPEVVSSRKFVEIAHERDLHAELIGI